MTKREGYSPTTAVLLIAGIVFAAFAEAVASTVLSVARLDLIGDVHATPDEYAWLDVSYVALKFIGFMAAPGLLANINPRRVVIAATLVMGASSGLAATIANLDALVALRAVQGLTGGILLVGGQSILFLAFPRSRQPVVQTLFAIGSVVAPATIAPAFQGWLVDNRSWTWIFFSILPVALASAGILLSAEDTNPIRLIRRNYDWLGLGLVSIPLLCFTFVLSQGNRWDWFEDQRIMLVTVLGVISSLAFFSQQALSKSRRLLELAMFQSDQFSFAFLVSFIAGAALFGSAYLIPAFATSVLAFTPTDAGLLLLPSGAFFVAALCFAAFLFQIVRIPPIATAPFGIIMIMTAMWMLSGSTRDSGAFDMMTAILVRGVGLGFLFLSITLIAFSDLGERALASGIGLFNLGRQAGGLVGVATLQTLIDHKIAANTAILGESLSPGSVMLDERLNATSAALVERGVDAYAASRAAAGLLNVALKGQSVVVAYEAAFQAVTLLFVVAVPLMIIFKIGLSRRAAIRSAQPGPAHS